MKKSFCDHCGEEFSATDEYVKAKIEISYTEYLGDDGSSFREEKIELCHQCFRKVYGVLKPKENSR
jgi:hypothetical protein